MKIKVLILIAVSAIATLSFTFNSAKPEAKKVVVPSNSNGNIPIGGFAFDEK